MPSSKQNGPEREPSPQPKPKEPKRSAVKRAIAHPIGKTLLALSIFTVTAGGLVFLYFYNKYATLIEAKLNDGPYSNTSKLFGTPKVLALRDSADPEEVASALDRAGYSQSRSNRMGWYTVRDREIEVYPGPDSYFQQEAHVVRFETGRVAQIISLRDNTERTQFWLEPELITNLFDQNREKRRIVRFQNIPKVMVNALLSAEDKRFFQHAGFDPFRVVKSAMVDIREGRLGMGASTLSMQLARTIWLTTERTWRRKIPEVLITMHLERKLSKEEIFEHYANSIYLGRVGTFNIHGFGEGARVYLGKDLRDVNLAEAALLAGIVQSPARFNPLVRPDRARTRRSIILTMMRDNGYINDAEFKEANEAPIRTPVGTSDSEDAPYFVDLVNAQLLNRFQDHDFQKSSYRVYTTLDVELQRAAAESIRAGLKEVDARLAKMGRTAAKGWPEVQAALVAMDPATGEIRALVGGRDYSKSQLNRAVASRQPGSIFKPFVYAAALETALENPSDGITPLSRVIDEPTQFFFDGRPYEPNNFGEKYHGEVTLRFALAHSLNVPAVKFAEKAGLMRVASLARKAGLTSTRPTPAMALGSYEVKPIEMAGAYTALANRGLHSEPFFINMIRDQDGHNIYTHKPVQKQIMDARIAYMITTLMEEVTRSGTGAGIRSRGFGLPAAGKTGSSRDGWFAGFTTELIAVAWVGYDDNRDLGLEGGKSALPIWTEFMKRAHKFRPYHRASSFRAPDGVVTLNIDTLTGRVAGLDGCGGGFKAEVFIAGTEPLERCGGGGTMVSGWDATESGGSAQEPPLTATRRVASVSVKTNEVPPVQAPAAESQPKKGLFGRILGVFR